MLDGYLSAFLTVFAMSSGVRLYSARSSSYFCADVPKRSCMPIRRVFTRLSADERIKMLQTNLLVRPIPVPRPREMIHQLRQVARALKGMPCPRPVQHLFKAGENMSNMLLSEHNLRFLSALSENIRLSIEEDRFLDYKQEFYSKYYGY